MGRQSLKIARNSPSSASHFFLRMEDKPTGSETIAVEEFRKGKAKREKKRVVIQEYVPPNVEPEPVPVPEPVPEPTPAPEPVPPPSAPSPDVDSIASRVADLLFAKMAVEKVEDTPDKVKTKAKPRAAPKKKEVEAPPAKYFGWC